MSNYLIYLKMEKYLAQWLVHEYGGEPIVFARNSSENDILLMGLIKLPENVLPEQPTDETVAIQLPTFKYKDVRVYNYLPKRAQAALKRCIRSRFMLSLWQDLHKFGYIGLRRQDLIYAWMEANGIEMTDTNSNTILKIYQRRRNVYRAQKYRENITDKVPRKKTDVTRNLFPKNN